jgi:hypothetical protein
MNFSFLMHVTCPTRLSLLYLIILLSGTEFKFKDIYYAVSPRSDLLLGVNILITALLSNTFKACSSISARGKVSPTPKSKKYFKSCVMSFNLYVLCFKREIPAKQSVTFFMFSCYEESGTSSHSSRYY